MRRPEPRHEVSSLHILTLHRRTHISLHPYQSLDADPDCVIPLLIPGTSISFVIRNASFPLSSSHLGKRPAQEKLHEKCIMIPLAHCSCLPLSPNKEVVTRCVYSSFVFSTDSYVQTKNREITAIDIVCKHCSFRQYNL